MMCLDCRQAGEALEAGYSGAAAQLHKRCADPDCTCQHRTDPNLINLERLNRDNDKANATEGHQPN